jgi:hypothetical protein
MYTVSPWTNLEEAVKEMGPGYAIDWRVNASEIIIEQDPVKMAKEVREGFKTAKGCSIVAVFQDSETVMGNKNLVRDWVRAAREGATQV